jgi:hypothetical protein
VTLSYPSSANGNCVDRLIAYNVITFGVYTAVRFYIVVSRCSTPCSLAGSCQCFEGTYCKPIQDGAQYGGSMLADRLQKDTVLQYRRHQSFKLFALRLNRLRQRLPNCEERTTGGGGRCWSSGGGHELFVRGTCLF